MNGATMSIVGASVLGGAIAWASVSGSSSWVPESKVTERPVEVQKREYVSSTTCRACHAHEHATWHDSYHRKMTQRASPEGVIGDFEDVTLERFGKTYRLERRGDEFWIEMDDPMAQPGPRPPARVERQVVMTTGSHHMQVYWYGSGHTRVTGMLPFVYLRQEQMWIPRLTAFVLPPSETISAEFGQWNIVCLKCHATGSLPRADYDEQGIRAADTQVAEFGIACEACHGPCEDHVEANRNPLHRYAMHLSDEPDDTVVNPARLDHRRSVQVCGQCHGNFDDKRGGSRLKEWFRDGYKFRPGDNLDDTRKVLTKGWDEQFWPDGVVRVAGREYNSLVGSGCYERGEMSCLSCHVMHKPNDDPRPLEEWTDDQILDGMDGDQACLQCHESYADDISAHTHHTPESSGSRCFNCHMPHSTYGLLKGNRNHRIVSPSIAMTHETGRPNACNQCHLDKSMVWAAEHLSTWYDIDTPKLTEDESSAAASVLWALKGDAAQRALVAWNFGWDEAQAASGTRWMEPYLAQLLDDPYEAVRLIALRSLRTLPGYEDFDYEFVGTPQQRAKARLDVRGRWQHKMTAADVGLWDAVLIGPDGTLRESEFMRLLKRRNNRPVSLLE